MWEGTLPDLEAGDAYKFRVSSAQGDYVVEKADPLAFGAERAPGTASVVCSLDYSWGDGAWMTSRASLP